MCVCKKMIHYYKYYKNAMIKVWGKLRKCTKHKYGTRLNYHSNLLKEKIKKNGTIAASYRLIMSQALVFKMIVLQTVDA